MRRSERELTSPEEIIGILNKNFVLRVACFDGKPEPYIVPMNYGFKYDDGKFVFYMHGAMSGRKAEAYSNSPSAAFEIDSGHSLMESGTACGYSYLYESVMGTGDVETIEDADEKKEGLDLIMRHLTGKNPPYAEGMISKVNVYKLKVRSISGKRNKD